jgi:CIC family chloride channel protein
LGSEFVGEHIPVIDMETGIMEGVITEADLFQAYLKLQNQIVDLERR